VGENPCSLLENPRGQQDIKCNRAASSLHCSYSDMGDAMAENTCWESFKVESETIVEKLKGVIREGNVRRVRVEHQGRTVAEFPLTAGVIGLVLAPVLAAIGALVALLKDCTIHVEKVAEPAQSPPADSAS
jgi:hypothetical protein